MFVHITGYSRRSRKFFKKFRDRKRQFSPRRKQDENDSKNLHFLIQRDTQRQSPSTANYYPPPSPCMLLQYCSVIMPNISRSTIWPSNGYKSNRSKLGDTGPLPFSHNVYTHVYTHVHTCIQRPIVVLPLPSP